MTDHDTDRVRQRFSAIYDSNEWGKGSGVGSTPENNLLYAMFLQKFMRANRVSTVVDLGCGDWQFSRFIDWTNIDYLGIDVAPMIVERNQRMFGTPQIRFEQFDSAEAVPGAHLLICKDVLQHLPNKFVINYLRIFRNKFKYMLITNDDGPQEYLNKEIDAGGWRSLRFDCHPFAETAGIVLQWAVLIPGGWTTKATYLFYGEKK